MSATKFSESSPPETSDRLPMRVLMGLRAPPAGDADRLYRAQLSAVDRLGAMQLVFALMVVVMVCGLYRHSVPIWLLGCWAAAGMLAAVAPFRQGRRRIREDYAGISIQDIRRQGFGMLLLGLLWAVPLLNFAPHGGSVEVMALWTATSCLLAGVAIAYASLPLATLGALCSVGTAAFGMMLNTGSVLLAALVISYVLVLAIASFKQARDFGSRVNTRNQLEEKSEVVSLLLREFEEGGSDWLWQTDASRRISGVSPRLAALLQVDPAELEGKPLVQILAGPAWESGQFDPALHALAEKLKRRESFSNLALPVQVGVRKCWWELSASPRTDDKGVFQGFRGVGSDITEQRESAEKIAQLARFDPLTGLPNRLQLTEALASALEGVERWSNRSAFLMVDLDRFKSVNDTLGHQVGDRLLEQVARRLSSICGKGEICGRIGGDEFAVVIHDVGDTLHVEQLALAIIDGLSRPYDVDQHTLFIGASVGSAIAPRDGNTPETLIRSADLSLYRCKDEGGGKHYGYEPKFHVDAEERRVLEIALREALEKDELHLVYQPVVTASEGEVIGFESLVRWTHPQMGSVSPAKFIPVAEEARLIAPIGEWVLRTACREAMNWPTSVRVAVNVSADQLANPNFAAQVVSALAHSGLSASRLELEVTESVFMREGTGAVQMLEQLLDLGIRLSLDDFGTGYSSLGYLSRVRFSTIKVDRTFVQGAAKNAPESLAIIRAVVAMADSLGMQTTAEGVETADEADLIHRLGCTKIQGYYFGRPMPAPEALALFGDRDQRVA